MPAIPPVILKKLYVKGSLRVEGDGLALDVKNTIAPGIILSVQGLELDGVPVDLPRLKIAQPDGPARSVEEISPQAPLPFPLGATFSLQAAGVSLDPGAHHLKIRVEVQDVGPIDIPVDDQVG
jgi:hydroxymethylglutaryl-CoA reductase (NADPH)